MGINGLLPQLKPCLRKVHIQEYRGKRLAVDAYVWLHKGTFSCAEELCQGIETEKYLGFCARMVDMLLHFGIVPVIVFDGDRLPMKSSEESSRRSSRKDSLQKANSLVQAGNYADAKKYFQQAVDVTPHMAKKFIELLKKKRVEYIVAPYEADAQLGFLARTGFVDGVITEDSDMIPYGVPLVLYKLKADGSAEEFHRTRLAQASKLNFHRFDQDKIITMCVLNGCDYLDSLPGIGIVTAHRLVNHYGNATTIFTHLRRQKSMQITKEYEDAFYRAFLTFKHQMVYDPRTKQMVNFSELPPELHDKDTSYLGQYHEPEIAHQIAIGDIHPMTKEPFEAGRSVIYANQKLTTTTSTSTLRLVPPVPLHQQQKITFFSKTTKKKVTKAPFKPPRPSSSQGSKQSQGSSESQETTGSTTPTSASSTTVTSGIFSASVDNEVTEEEESSRGTSQRKQKIPSSQQYQDDHVPLLANKQRKGRLTLPPRHSGSLSSRSVISNRIQRKSLLSASQEDEDEFSSDSDENIPTPPKKCHSSMSTRVLSSTQETVTSSTTKVTPGGSRHTAFTRKVSVEKDETYTTTATLLQRSVTSDSDDSTGSRKRHRSSPTTPTSIAEDSSTRPKKKQCTSRFFSKSSEDLAPMPVRRTPLPPQKRIDTTKMLQDEDVSFALNPLFEEESGSLKEASTTNKTPTTRSTSIASKSRTTLFTSHESHTDGEQLRKKFSSYIMENVIEIDDNDSDTEQQTAAPQPRTPTKSRFFHDGELVNSSSPPPSPPNSARKTPSLFLNFLEKCKAKGKQQQKNSVGDLRKMGGADNPIVL